MSSTMAMWLCVGKAWAIFVRCLVGAGMLAFLLPGFDGSPPSNAWQEGLCARPDILSFVSEPLEEPLHIAGEIEVALNVASSAPDTAFTAKLVEVLADGRVRYAGQQGVHCRGVRQRGLHRHVHKNRPPS